MSKELTKEGRSQTCLLPLYELGECCFPAFFVFNRIVLREVLHILDRLYNDLTPDRMKYTKHSLHRKTSLRRAVQPPSSKRTEDRPANDAALGLLGVYHPPVSLQQHHATARSN